MANTGSGSLATIFFLFMFQAALLKVSQFRYTIFTPRCLREPVVILVSGNKKKEELKCPTDKIMDLLCGNASCRIAAALVISPVNDNSRLNANQPQRLGCRNYFFDKVVPVNTDSDVLSIITEALFLEGDVNVEVNVVDAKTSEPKTSGLVVSKEINSIYDSMDCNPQGVNIIIGNLCLICTTITDKKPDVMQPSKEPAASNKLLKGNSHIKGPQQKVRATTMADSLCLERGAYSRASKVQLLNRTPTGSLYSLSQVATTMTS
ncbi:hypothetical protein PAMA_005722 [Pampus argenteus]